MAISKDSIKPKKETAVLDKERTMSDINNELAAHNAQEELLLSERALSEAKQLLTEAEKQLIVYSQTDLGRASAGWVNKALLKLNMTKDAMKLI
jgi:hypothetical protein